MRKIKFISQLYVVLKILDTVFRKKKKNALDYYSSYRILFMYR